ncbi:hypothetical protein ACH5RR_041296 [Cinchona calisaya]|uniref:Uncharacterized protein n=1 Tax=Cinchona calisaya TaxID=153742 RepID=A0ABD2XWG5_9GENT
MREEGVAVMRKDGKGDTWRVGGGKVTRKEREGMGDGKSEGRGGGGGGGGGGEKSCKGIYGDEERTYGGIARCWRSRKRKVILMVDGNG